MNAKHLTLATGLSICTALTALAGPPIVVISPPAVTVAVPAPVVTVPAPVVVAPAPGVAVVSTVPDGYVWDGTEYVGVVGTQYYYLGPDKVWLPFDRVHTDRFTVWSRGHADWRTHVTRNDLYRRDAHGHSYPAHDVHHDPGHDAGHDVNHDDHHDDHGR